ncbi:hypothetical protein G4228_015634 [Cervus hanglu yarkandensis]|nr:hypothetical protein G4228_015634 [Cervus hanglu yarkandensis]
MQQMLDENHHLIQCILDYQSKGKTAECTQYQQILHRNLVYLATIADSNQNMQSLLPAPPTQSMTLGPGGLSQSGSAQGLHSQGSLSDAIGAGLPPSSLMQAQIGNGPNHVSLQQTAQSTLPTTSMSMSGSGHGSGPGYSHSGPASQSVPLQSQGAISNYVSRANINMQSNPVSMMHQQAASSHYSAAQGGSQHYQGQSMAMMGQSGQGGGVMGQRPMAPYRPSQQGSSQQYLGQEEYYGSEQYGHGQAASEPMSQQYYPDGHGDYAYQPASYTEQTYDRSFEDSTQHYYEGGNSQYSQQQTGYQQGTAQQQTYSQQQYPNQQSYPGQQQGYVDQHVKSLSSVLSRYQGFDGEDGGRKNCFGRNGSILYIRVPVGTLVKEGSEVLADLSRPGDEFIAAVGGSGGKGNRFFLANDNRAPTTCTPGQPGQERILFLELKTVAHAGLVGFPNAGKSSLLRAISNARPAVASYPFTTLNPHVGIVHYEDHQQIAVADIPGIIRGAHQNRGLGLAFLRHIERCPFLLFLVDLSVPEPWTQLDDLRYELEQYDEGLSKRPYAVVANKIDLPQARARLPQLQARLGQEAIALSAATGENLEELLLRLKELHDRHVAAELARGRQPLRW